MKNISRRIRAALTAIKDSAPDLDIIDAHTYGGLALLGYGLHQLSPAAAFAVCGLMLFWMGVRR